MNRKNGKNPKYQESLKKAKDKAKIRFLESKKWKTTVTSLSKLGLNKNSIKQVQIQALKQHMKNKGL